MRDCKNQEVAIGDIIESVLPGGHRGKVVAIHEEGYSEGVEIQRLDKNGNYITWDWVEEGYLADPYYISTICMRNEYRVV